MYDYFLTEDQASLKKMVSDFMQKEIVPHISEWEPEGIFPLEVYKKAFELGFHCLDIPEEYGGAGLDKATMSVIFEEMGRHEPAFAITLECASLALKCAILGGNEKQIKIVADVIVPGAFGAFCLTEADSGSNSAAMHTSYVKEGDEYVLNGTKCFITNGGYAKIGVVFATRDRALGSKGISAFIVEFDRPGVSVGKHEDKMGLRMSNTTDLALDNVRIPADNLIGEEGGGFAIAMQGLNAGRLFIGSIGLGIAQGALEHAVKYAKVRTPFGKPIIRHEGIQFMLADMATLIEASRHLARYAARCLDENKEADKVCSMTKSFCTDTAVRVTTDAVQVLGGYGYSKEYPVEKLMRDAKIFQIFEGTNQIQRMIIGRRLEAEY